MNFDDIVSRIKQIKKLHYDVEVADLLGFTKNAFAERKKRNSIPQDRLALFCEREHININWLLTGEGSKYQEEKAMPGMINEPPAAYSGETIAALVKKVQKIYKDGDLSECAAIRGMIDEVYERLIRKIDDRLKAAAAEPALKKTNNAG